MRGCSAGRQYGRYILFIFARAKQALLRNAGWMGASGERNVRAADYICEFSNGTKVTVCTRLDGIRTISREGRREEERERRGRANEIIHGFWKENNSGLMAAASPPSRQSTSLRGCIHAHPQTWCNISAEVFTRERNGKLNSQKRIDLSRGDDVARIITVFRRWHADNKS